MLFVLPIPGAEIPENTAFETPTLIVSEDGPGDEGAGSPFTDFPGEPSLLSYPAPETVS